MQPDSTTDVSDIHTTPLPADIDIKIMEGEGETITGFALFSETDEVTPITTAPVIPVKPPMGNRNVPIHAGNLVYTTTPAGSAYAFVLKPLDMQLLDEAREDYAEAMAANPLTVAGANRRKRKMAATVLCLHAALHARAFRIVAERYGESVDVLKDVEFAGMWHKVKNHIARDSYITTEGARWKRIVADVLKFYNHRHLIAHYTGTQAFDADIAELQRLIERGLTLLQATDAIVVSLMTPEDWTPTLPEQTTEAG